MDQKDRVAYASRGPTMATMVEFFQAVDVAIKKFKEHGPSSDEEENDAGEMTEDVQSYLKVC